MNLETKIAFWMTAIGFLLFATDGLLLGKFWHIPSPSDIHYSTGIVHVIKSPSKHNTTVNHIQLKTKDGQLLHLACSYTAYYYSKRSYCISHYEKELVSKIYGKQATVGWYIQKPLLGINNPYPQLIDLNVEGEQIISYQKRIELMRSDVKPTIIYILFQLTIAISTFLFLYRVYNPKIKKN